MDIEYLANRILDENKDWYTFDDTPTSDIFHLLFKLYLNVTRTNILNLKEIYDEEYIIANNKFKKIGYTIEMLEMDEDELKKLSPDLLICSYSKLPRKYLMHPYLEIYLDGCIQNNQFVKENQSLEDYYGIIITNNSRFFKFQISLKNYNKKYAELFSSI